ncbi:putative restriction endonuclease [Mesonia phycicola]|uniref:Putative restriction endonuclease n=1 Tax=Mesonia phycicola TaxID=579105 RepID=A0A1M6HRB7_9FLAO|nr:HNH endonuclease [Mesonia phycicola]SHJ24731.1 putative restriction endonuclease [Mesonia phycicola]
MVITDKFDNYTIAEVIKAYLIDGQSHRNIQREILNLPAPARGGGFVAMELLHHYNIRGDKKGLLTKKSISKLNATNDLEFKKALQIIEELNFVEEEAEEYFIKNQEINKSNNPTESKSEIKIRAYQNKLREIVLDNYNSTCAICEINKSDLLVCSHIKPWMSDKEERLNPQNAICFCVLHDKMFDKGYFSLDSEYRIVFGPKSDKQIKKLLTDLEFKKPKVNEPNISFLEYHYNEICK